jgi:hypothetical protein
VRAGLDIVGTASETAVVGETANLAAPQQGLAQPNQIVVSAATRAMLGDHFDLEDLGAYEFKGFAEPVPVWRVLSARDVESRFAATRTGSSAPLVGRQEEMGLLLRAWDGSCHGRGQVVLIQGEAGVGKSRLVEGLRAAAGKDRIWVAIRCSPFHTASAFHPIAECRGPPPARGRTCGADRHRDGTSDRDQIGEGAEIHEMPSPLDFATKPS